MQQETDEAEHDQKAECQPDVPEAHRKHCGTHFLDYNGEDRETDNRHDKVELPHGFALDSGCKSPRNLDNIGDCSNSLMDSSAVPKIRTSVTDVVEAGNQKSPTLR